MIPTNRVVTQLRVMTNERARVMKLCRACAGVAEGGAHGGVLARRRHRAARDAVPAARAVHPSSVLGTRGAPRILSAGTHPVHRIRAHPPTPWDRRSECVLALSWGGAPRIARAGAASRVPDPFFDKCLQLRQWKKQTKLVPPTHEPPRAAVHLQPQRTFYRLMHVSQQSGAVTSPQCTSYVHLCAVSASAATGVPQSEHPPPKSFQFEHVSSVQGL